MREVILTAQFRRDVKLVERRGKKTAKLRKLVLLLAGGNPLPVQYKDHSLSADWKHHRDSHIEPERLLLYRVDGHDLYPVRTGSHADLF